MNMKELPKEIWALRLVETGRLLPPIDEDSTGVFLAWPSREEAEQGREHQAQWFDGLGVLEVVQVK